MTKAELLDKLRIVGGDTSQRNSVTCALIGHSRIRTFCFGYNYCARCEAQMGDSLGGTFKVSDEYIEGHTDKECLANLLKMTWKDKLYVPKKIYSKGEDRDAN